MIVWSKISNWLGDRRHKSLIERVVADELTYLSREKLYRLARAFSIVKEGDINGDFLEFGVALGGSAVLIASQLDSHRRFHGFDVFAMIPPPESDKDDEKSRERYKVIQSGGSNGIGEGQYYGYRTDLHQEVCRTFERYQVPVDGAKVVLHKGLFQETWSPSGITKVAFAHIDCDWYDPVKFCLNSVDAVLSPGGIIVMDDYNDYGGCRVAVDEFLSEKSNYEFQDGVNPSLHKRR